MTNLWVDEEWEAAAACDEDAVLDGEVVLRQALHVPVPNRAHVHQEVQQTVLCYQREGGRVRGPY
jgi:hypothetical protein